MRKIALLMIQASLPSFLGSLAAGLLLLAVTYWLITRPLEIVRPVKERRAKLATVFRMIEDELSSCLRMDAIHQDPKDERVMLGRFPTSRWEAARASESFRLLPPRITAVVFEAYARISVFNLLAEKIEAAEFASWTTNEPGRSGAEILRRNWLSQIRDTSKIAAQECRKALEEVATELNSSTL